MYKPANYPENNYCFPWLDNILANDGLPDYVAVEIDNDCHHGYLFCPYCKRAMLYALKLNYIHLKNCPNHDDRGCIYFCAQEEYDRIILFRGDKTTDRG